MIYLDNAATTKPDAAVLDVMRRVAEEDYANPAALYREGFKANKILESARKIIADALSCKASEVYFTATGTEANNLAIIGSARARKNFADEIVASSYEHASVSNTVAALGREGFKLRPVDPGADGRLDADLLIGEVGKRTALVTVMQVNNETGAMIDIAALAARVKAVNPRTAVHCDLVQGFLKYPVKLKGSGIDTASVCAHKIHGPKGIGALYVREGFNIEQSVFGGGQERGLRSGTSSAYLAAAFAEAVRLYDSEAAAERAAGLNKYLRERLSLIEGAVVNSPCDASAYILNLSMPSYRSETLLHYLDDNGVMVSSGSTCARGEKSRTLRAMGLADGMVESSLRISFSKDNSKEEIDRLAELLSKVKDRLVSIKG